jgi:tripartite-type tricarboxylate transporter receptor subunit TctC
MEMSMNVKSLNPLAVLVVCCAMLGANVAAGYPERPITLVVPFPPGGAADVIGRILAKKIGENLGQTVVVENRPGAGTIIAAEAVSKAPPDGYMLLISSGTTFTVNPAIHAQLPYDPVKSFEPLGIVGRTPLILLANPKTPVDTLPQLVAAAKAAPDKFTYGSFGNGTTAHFAGEMIKSVTGIKLLHVPYRGSSPAMTDLIGGQIALSVDTVAAAAPQIKSGKVKAIAIMSPRRSALLPNVPTAAEAGYPAIDMDTWIALVGPRGLPSAVKDKLEKAVASVMADQSTKDTLLTSGFEPTYGTSADLAALIANELPRMREIAKRENIKAD